MNTLTQQKPADADPILLPVVQTGRALQSLRDSGFSLPTALAEVVDNSVEAKASRVLIELREATLAGKKHIHEIAVADNGDGMDHDILWHYPVIGFSSRYMRTDTIGKYGVGAKLAALNFGKRLDVWSRTSIKAPWLHVYFDLDETIKAETAGLAAGIASPDQTSVPANLRHLLPADTGTLVRWSKVDRLEEGRRAPDFNELQAEVIKDLARMFREFLSAGTTIRVNDTELLPHDPLFLMQDSWGDAVLTKHLRLKKATHFPAEIAWSEKFTVAGATVNWKITVYPPEVLRTRGKGGDELSKALRVPDNLGAISFMRGGREIAYTVVPRLLPTGVRPADRFIGIEVSFGPELDEYFGVRNVKRGVEPQGELRDKLREVFTKFIPQARKAINETWDQNVKAEEEAFGKHSPILDAIREVNRLMPGSRAPQASDDQIRDELEQLAKDTKNDDSPEHVEEYVERTKDLPFVLENVDYPGKQFIDVRLLGNKVIVRINTRHRFYREMWQPLAEVAAMDPTAVSGDEVTKTAKRAVEGLTLMIVAYGKAMSMSPRPDSYDELTTDWGRFIDTLMGKVKDVL